MVATGLALGGYAARTLRTLDLNTVNARFSVRGAEKPPKNIVMVAVDDASISTVNKQWPFPRAVEAKVLNRIAAGHPSAVAFDIVFSDPSSLGQNDDVALLNALGNDNVNGRVVLSFQETDGKGDVKLFGLGQTQKALRQAGVEPGMTQFPFDPGDYVRRMSYSIDKLVTFPVATARGRDRQARPPLQRAASGSTTSDRPAHSTRSRSATSIRARSRRASSRARSW